MAIAGIAWARSSRRRRASRGEGASGSLALGARTERQARSRHPSAGIGHLQARRAGVTIGATGLRPNDRSTTSQACLMAPVDQSRSWRAHRNSRARMARPSGITTTLVPGMGTISSATPQRSTANPAMAMPSLCIQDDVEGPVAMRPRRSASSRRRTCIHQLWCSQGDGASRFGHDATSIQPRRQRLFLRWSR